MIVGREKGMDIPSGEFDDGAVIITFFLYEIFRNGLR